MGKYEAWYDSLPEHTKAYLKKQPVWHDKDVALFVSSALAIGFVIGWMVH